MAGTSLYDLIIPTFINGLRTLDHVLTKAEEFAKEKGLDANQVFPEARLIEDQLPLTFQVQNASKAVQVNIGRLTGVEPELFENNEKTIEDLHKRIEKTLDLLKKVKPEDVNSREDALVDVPFGGQTHQLPAKAAILGQGQPNFYFHLVTAYSILRAKGVPVGKADWIVKFINV